MKRQSNLNLLLATVALLLFACNQKAVVTNSEKPKVATKTTKDTSARISEITPKKDSILPKPILNFFDFDAVDHYTIDYDGSIAEEDDTLNPFQKKLLKSTNNDTVKFKFLNKLLNNIIYGGCPKNTSDFGFVDYLIEMGFEKNEIPKSKLNKLNLIFSKKPCPNELIYTDCAPFFRDIYVFKKNKLVIGIASICFSCGDYFFTGANMNTKCFGYHGEYEQLEKLFQYNY